MYSSPSSARAHSGNVPAMVSLLASLVVPLTIVPYLIFPSIVFNSAFNVLQVVFIPVVVTAIVTGHVALFRAKKVQRASAHRWMAILGLLLGYLGIVAVVWVFVGLLTAFMSL